MKKIMIVILLSGAFGAAIWFLRKKPTEIKYRDVAIARTDMNVTISSTGTVQPENRLEIKPPIAGRVEKIAVAEGERVRKGQILAWMSSTERAALLDAARSQGPEELKRWEEMYRPTPILAPISGTLIKRNVESGQTFTSSDAVFVMSDRLTVKAQVDETDISGIALGQPATILLDAYPENPIPAKVDQIAYDATTVNNITTYTVDVLPEKTLDFMRSGMTANITFHIASRKQVIAIPNDALKVQNDSYFVLIKPADPKLPPTKRDIKIGLSDGKKTEVVDGLSEGEILSVAEVKTGSSSANRRNPFQPARTPRAGAR